VLADSAYGSGETRATLRAAKHHQTIKVIPRRNTRTPGAFTKDDFEIDLRACTVTCPAGQTRVLDQQRRARFRAACQDCDLRSRCTTSSEGRVVTVHPHEDELLAARARAHTPEFINSYRRWRPMAERSIAWLTAHHNRRLRYRGVQRNQLWLSTRVAAINLRRLINLGLTNDPTGWALS